MNNVTKDKELPKGGINKVLVKQVKLLKTV